MRQPIVSLSKFAFCWLERKTDGIAQGFSAIFVFSRFLEDFASIGYVSGYEYT